jgi:hypothetical protein
MERLLGGLIFFLTVEVYDEVYDNETDVSMTQSIDHLLMRLSPFLWYV